MILAVVARDLATPAHERAHRELASFLPVVAVLDRGAFACDLRGTTRLLGAPDVVARKALWLVGEPFAAGLATTPFTARLLAERAPANEVRALGSDDAQRGFLEELELEVLPLDHVVIEELRLLGIRRVGAFAALPVAAVLDRFGLAVAHAHALARGEDPAVLVGTSAPVRLSGGRRFESAIEWFEPLLFALRSIVDELALRLREGGFAALRLAVRLEREDAHPLRFERLVLPPTAESAALLRSLRWALEEHELGRVTGVEIDAIAVEPARGRQLGLFAPDGARKEDAQAVSAYLRARLGKGRVLRTRVVDEEPRVPERAAEFEEVVS